MRRRKTKIQRGGRSTLAWLPMALGATLTARADLTQSEQEAFDRYFRMPAVSQEPAWKQHFSLGAAVGFNISAKFNENGLFNLPGNGLASGYYNDGYVLPDNSGDPTTTVNWGYQTATQVQNTPAGQVVVMHETTSYQTSATSSSDAGGPFPGFELVYGGSLHHWQNFRIGWDLGFELTPMKISDNETLSATASQNAYDFTVPPGVILQGPGYQGTANSAGHGPLLETTPTVTSSQTSGFVSGSRSLNAILYGFRLGPTFYWDFSKNCGLSVGAGPALGLVSAEYKYNELITANGVSAPNSGSFSGLDVVYGGAVNATLFYHASEAGRPVDLYLSAQFMPLGSADFSQGGRDARLDLSGQLYLSAGVNWPF